MVDIYTRRPSSPAGSRAGETADQVRSSLSEIESCELARQNLEIGRIFRAATRIGERRHDPDPEEAIAMLAPYRKALTDVQLCHLAALYNKNEQPEEAIFILKPLLTSGQYLLCPESAHNVYASALINIGSPEKAVDYLHPLLEPDELLSCNEVSHNIYAKALIESGRPKAAADHLRPLLGAGQLLCVNLASHATYARALIRDRHPHEADAYLKKLQLSDRLARHDIGIRKAREEALSATSDLPNRRLHGKRPVFPAKKHE